VAFFFAPFFFARKKERSGEAVRVTPQKQPVLTVILAKGLSMLLCS
jgi:hypothetical protein